MAAFRAVTSFVHGSAQTEIAIREYQERNGWTSGDETRQALAPQMRYLMSTGRYPTFEQYALSATRKDDRLGVRVRPRLRARRHRAATRDLTGRRARTREAPALLDGGGPGLPL
jgi:hypothetical protein